ncbi:hypothetical protein LZ30DRAFT_38650 [Colletotrichum cereale]|nr:hypothetical protein LZ30DRAFT_38650 [Colletotrichum cereale]
MSVSMDNICFYQPPTPVVRQRAPKATGQRSSSTCPSIMEEVAVQPTIGSCTHHRAASSSADPAGLTSEVHMKMVGDVLAQRDSTSSRISSNFGPETTPSVPVEEPTALGTTLESRAAGTSTTRSLSKASIPTTSPPFTLTGPSADPSPKSYHNGKNEANTAGSQAIGDCAESTPETTLERYNGDATSPSRREQETIASSVSLRNALPAWLECCRSQSARNEQTQEGSELAMTVSGMSGSMRQSTEDDPMSTVLSSSVTTSPRGTGYSVTPTGICRAVLGRSTTEETIVPSAEQQLGNSRGEAEPEVAAEPSSTSCMSSPAPREVVGFGNVAHISSTAPPPPAPSTSAPPSSAPPTAALRRSRRGKVPAGGYAEVDSDAESNADEGLNMSSDDDIPSGKRTSPLDSSGQLGIKRRKACFHEESAREGSAPKRFCGSRRTATRPAKSKRRSQRIAEHIEEVDMVSPPRSESASVEEQSADHVLATFDEFPLRSTPLNNFVLKRTVVGHTTTFTIEWQQVNTHHRCQAPPEVVQPSSLSLLEPDLAQFPTGHRRAFSKDEDELLRNLKQKKTLSWKEIHRDFSVKFPGRSIGTLQVRYSTKLNY